MTCGNNQTWSGTESPKWRTLGCRLSLANTPSQRAKRQRAEKQGELQDLVAGLTRLALALVAVLGIPALCSAEKPVPMQVGWVERVALYPGGFIIPAKVDTGAVSCSLHCANPTMYKKDGKPWVKFTIKDADGKAVTIDREIVGERRIKRHYGGFQMRPVIRMGVCLGSLYQESDVNLVDRTGFEYPMLIGRNFMGEHLVVNPSVKHSVEPTCKMDKR